MAANLKGRLARIKNLGAAKADDRGETSASKAGGNQARRARPAFLKGWERRDDFLWSRVLRLSPFSLQSSVDPEPFAPLGRRRLRERETSRTTGTPDIPERVVSERLRFFDLETTGLSGGTGTVAFLAAVGRTVDESFELTQLFLEDFPGEGAFVESLLELLKDGVVVSYNGKAFDMPLLRTRCVMNAIQLPSYPHIDALFAARRLWKRVHGGAALELLEREVLGIERGEDIPGSMIPDVWLNFARTGESPFMHLVLSHNATDVVTLARLVSRVQSIFEDPRSQVTKPDVDLAGLGRSLIAIGRTGEGEELLEAAAGEGDEIAALSLMKRYRLAARQEDCIRVESLLPDSFRAAVEKTKLHERLLRDWTSAAKWAEKALRLAPEGGEREAAERRLRRIKRKIAGERRRS
jgi:uncharacterized protein